MGKGKMLMRLQQQEQRLKEEQQRLKEEEQRLKDREEKQKKAKESHELRLEYLTLMKQLKISTHGRRDWREHLEELKLMTANH
tara:strand:+ start:2849 stop:3097 length:249 start_codon:yes stop_codon:yes gene_type:complete